MSYGVLPTSPTRTDTSDLVFFGSRRNRYVEMILSNLRGTSEKWSTSRLVEILKFHLASVPDSDLVFANERAGIVDYGNFRERVFAPAVERSGLEPFTFHDLRHTHVAWLIDADWSEYRIVRRMGWKDSRMLYTTYGHLLDKHNREGMATLEERWNGAPAPFVGQGLLGE